MISVASSIAGALTVYVSWLSEFKNLAGTLNAVPWLSVTHKAKVSFHKSEIYKSEGVSNNSFDFMAFQSMLINTQFV